MIRQIIGQAVTLIIKPIVKKFTSVFALWKDNGSGAINTPWNDSNNWTE